MIIYRPNPNKKININNFRTKNSVKNTNIFKELSDQFNYTPEILRITKLKETRSIDRSTTIPKNNDRRNVRMPLDTTAVRNNQRNYFTGKFNRGFRKSSNYPLCPQKISTVFQSGTLFWSHSTINNGSSYPFKSSLVNIKTIPRLRTNDCVCYYVDFNGEYELDWSASEGGQLISSSNPNVLLGSFNFNTEDEFFNIFLYPKQSLNHSSYLQVSYRIPVQYRYSYGDWSFWENLIITEQLSETEFVRVIDCCNIGESSPLFYGYII